MADRPYTLLSCGMSIDGYLDGATAAAAAAVQRRRLRPGRRGAGDAATRSWSARRRCATTTRGCWCARRQRRDERVARGLRPSPMKVTVTGSGELDPDADFFAAGDAEKLVYCASPAVDRDARTGSARWPPSSTAASRWTCDRVSEDLLRTAACAG